MTPISGFWAWSDAPPWHVGSCVNCGCLVLLLPFCDDRVALFDPSFTARRWLRSILAPGSLICQGFASTPAGLAPHECPPEDRCNLPRAARRAAAYHIAQRYGKGGVN